MGEYLEYPAARPMKVAGSRRGLLMGFGILAILIAVAGAGVVAVSAYTYVRIASLGRASFPARVTAGVILSDVMMLFLAGGIAWGGVAMVRCRRWVLVAGRAMSLLALAIGLLILEVMIAEFVVAEEFVEGGTGDAGAYGIAIAAVLIVGVAIPLAYLAVLAGPRVRRTLEAYDPYPVWTDRYPGPVLLLGLWSFYLGLLASTWVGEPFAYCFGRFVGGRGVVVMAVAWSAALLLTSAACAARSRLAWWLAGAVCVLYPVSMLLTIWLGDPRATFGDVSLVDSTPYLAKRLEQWSYLRINQTVLCVACGLAAVVYLLRTRACVFGPDEPWTATGSAPAIPAAPVDAPAPPRILSPDDPPAD